MVGWGCESAAISIGRSGSCRSAEVLNGVTLAACPGNGLFFITKRWLTFSIAQMFYCVKGDHKHAALGWRAVRRAEAQPMVVNWRESAESWILGVTTPRPRLQAIEDTTWARLPHMRYKHKCPSSANVGRVCNWTSRSASARFRKHLPKVRQQSHYTWATFLQNHAGDIRACDSTMDASHSQHQIASCTWASAQSHNARGASSRV